MLWVKFPVVDKIHPQSNRFATGVEKKVTGDSKLKNNTDPGLFKFTPPTFSKVLIFVCPEDLKKLDSTVEVGCLKKVESKEQCSKFIFFLFSPF